MNEFVMSNDGDLIRRTPQLGLNAGGESQNSGEPQQ